MKKRLGEMLRKIAPAASPWQPAGAPYPALAQLDVKPLKGQAGIYALWHLGVRPRWLRVGGAADLGAALTRAKDAADLRAAEAHGGVYAAWAPLAVGDIPAVLGTLAAALRPVLQDLVLAGEIAAGKPGPDFPLPPGTRMPAPVKTRDG
jgi:hypothetical protein